MATEKQMAPVDIWAAEVAKVYKEEGEKAAIVRRNRLSETHKWTTATYVVFLDKLRKLVKES